MAFVANAQVKKTVQPEENVFVKVELEATTNEEAWNKHIRKYSVLPDGLRKKVPPGKYVVVVQFVVDKYGNMGDLKAVTDPGYGLGEFAVGIIQKYSGEWKPATQCGRQVKAYKKQPITFVVSE